MKKTTMLLVIMLVLAMLMAGCGGKASLVGRWQTENGDSTIEFYKNGDANLDGTLYKYEIMSDSKIKFQENPFTNPEVLEYKLSGKKLEIGGYVFTKQ
jgi:ABC-type glycerol-3-phosphate transport system substrate-binding protein